MYNVFKNKLRPYIFRTFSKSSYELVSEVQGKEEVYCRDDKLVVVVHDYTIGNRIYSTIKSLNESGERISTGAISFSIGEYFVDKFDRVEMFYVNFGNILDVKWKELSDIQKLQQFVAITASMERSGYSFNNGKFDINFADTFSGFISFFEKDNENSNPSNYESIIRYIHYVLSGCDNFEEVYTRLVTQKEICAISSFNYSLPVIKMCYNYFVTREINLGRIARTLDREYLESSCMQYYAGYSIVGDKDLSLAFPVTEKCDEYTVYDGCIKIFNEMPLYFEDFLRENGSIIKDSFEYVVEKIDTIIIDCNSDIVGYKFQRFQSGNINSILEQQLTSQKRIIEFMYALNVYISEVERTFSAQPFNQKNDFDLEKDLVVYTEYGLGFKLVNPMAIFKLTISKGNRTDKEIVNVFFKIYAKYLNAKYGELSDEKEYFAKPEIRYLSPAIAKAFVDFTLGKKVDYFNVPQEFHKFLHDTKRVANQEYFYDLRFGYNPTEVPYIFDYEVEEKYGIDVNRTVTGESRIAHTLPDGRRLITFNGRKKNVSSLVRLESSRKTKIHSTFKEFRKCDHISIIGVSEVIYSRNITTDGNEYFEVIGFVTTPYKGRNLNDKTLLSLNNKDFFKLAGNLFYAFDNAYIDLESCYIDEDFHVYIDIFSKSFEVKPFSRVGSYISWLSNYLIDNGYSSNAFVGVDLTMHSSSAYIQYANSLDSFCDEHQIYYNSENKMCPVCGRAKAYIPKDFEARAEKVFEDEIAVHYIFDYSFNIKIYKKDFPKSDLEKNVDNIIGLRLLSGDVNLHQDCFIPYKKAVDENNQFMGYIYRTVPFKPRYEGRAYCVNIAEIAAMKNLPRLMSLIRLISQVEDLISQGYCFIKNPFGSVFLNKNYKKQVQILNIEFLRKGKKSKNTGKWTIEYVYSVLANDDTLEDFKEITNHPTSDLSVLRRRLQALSKKMTRYCPVHNMYYKEEDLFCPKCVDKQQIKDINIEYVNVSDFDVSKHENEGGESFIYPYGENQVAKIFKAEEINYDFKNLILARVLSRINVLNRLNSLSKKVQYVVPRKILVDKATGRICGYVMDRVVDAMSISNLRDKEQIQKLNFDRQDVLEVLINAGEGIEVLHSKANMFIGDLNGRNILFTRKKTVYFLDFDGMGIDDINPMFWTEGYIDPVSAKNKNITMKDDWYSFAIQAFYYLTYTHPFNGIYYVKENNRKVNLEIPDKMERRISLLGHHKIEVPDIAEPWDWMISELQTIFLNIFEGSNRDSIVPTLKKQYLELYGSNKWTSTWDEVLNGYGDDDKAKITKITLRKVKPITGQSVQSPEDKSTGVIRISPKFVAKVINPFNSNISHLINPFSAVCGTDDHVAVIDNNDSLIIHQVNVRDCREVNDILLLEDSRVVWVIYKDRVTAMDLSSNQELYSEKYPDVENPIVNGNTLYFLCDNDIISLDYKPNGIIKKGQIDFLNERLTKHFFARHNSKFVIIKKRDDSTDDIFCNEIKLCDINPLSYNTKYKAMYDNVTRMWLVISSDGTVVAINANNGEYEKFDIQVPINDMDVDNVAFVKGKLYIPSQDSLYIVNVKDQTTKRMECPKIMTPESKLFDINSSGYSIATDCNLYEIRKG